MDLTERPARPGGGSDAAYARAALLAGLVAIPFCWPIVKQIIPPDARFQFADLLLEHWAHRQQLEPWINQRWAWLAMNGYRTWFSLAALPGVLVTCILLAATTRSPLALPAGAAGWCLGALLGAWLTAGSEEGLWPLVVSAPALLGLVGGAITGRLAARPHPQRLLRGARVRPWRFRRSRRVLARLLGEVTLAGVPLGRVEETRHVAAIGMTGSGKSTALLGLMADACRRGDRLVVADPEGTAMALFHQPGDIILNPFHDDCARWDLLSEIERPSDHAFIAQSVLPHSGVGEHDQWITYAQQLLAGVLENFVTLELGTSEDLIEMLTSASLAELRQLCSGTTAQRYFEEGGERMLASILGTMAPAISHLRLIGAVPGEPFSLRQWIRSGSGSVWLPYAANETAALKGLVSCWMNIAILETMSLEPSVERRIWFHVDELDALGRIEGLKDALARLRKFGGCVALGFQSFAQVRQIYGEGAHTNIENCGNLLLLRSGASGDGGTAELCARLVGERETEREDVSRSRTLAKAASSSTSFQVRRSTDDALLASEFMQLADGEGFLKRAGQAHWIKLKP